MRNALIATVLCALAAPAAAEVVDPEADATVHHVPPTEASPGESLQLVAVIDGAWKEAGLVARYRPIGLDTPFAQAPFERSSAGGYFATIPASAVGRPGLEYYIIGVNRHGEEVAHFASPDWPHPVRVEPPRDKRWVEAELSRLAGRRSVISARAQYIDFGGVDGAADHLMMGEIDWRHRMVGVLYDIHLGFGAIDGVTPSGTVAPTELDRGIRYGYGGMRLRLHRRVWVDGRAVIGWGTEGFVTGGGGAIVLGRDWATNVTIGGDYIEELGPRARIRLQWDTVPRFLMGLQVVVTDWPDAEIESGSYLAYDIAYPVTSQLKLVGQLSFGARGNRPGGVGAGLGTTFEF